MRMQVGFPQKKISNEIDDLSVWLNSIGKSEETIYLRRKRFY